MSTRSSRAVRMSVTLMAMFVVVWVDDGGGEVGVEELIYW